MSVIRNELTLLWVAIGYFTRIPVPQWVWTDQDRLNRASRYFGVVGLLVGLISAWVFWVGSEFWSVSVGVILAMIATVKITGGFHEDGLADTADGLGGGWQVADKLRIMKDSRLGSYGALSLILCLLLKWQVLTHIGEYSIPLACAAMIAGHTLSRVVAASLIFTEHYVRDGDIADGDDSKSKPIVTEQHWGDLGVLLLTATAVLAWLFYLSDTWLIVLLLPWVLYLVRAVTAHQLREQIGGYTGDTLGACQQLSELVVYLMLMLLWGVSFA